MEIVKKDIVSITADELMKKSAEFINKLAEVYHNECGEKMPIAIVLQAGLMWVEVAKELSLGDNDAKEVTPDDLCFATAQALVNIEKIIEHPLDEEVRDGLICIASATIAYIFGEDLLESVKVATGTH